MRLQKVENVSKQIMKFTRLSIYLTNRQRNQTLVIQILQNMRQKKQKHSVNRLNNNSKILMKYTGLQNYLKVKKIVTERKNLRI